MKSGTSCGAICFGKSLGETHKAGTQSPLAAEGSAYKNATTSALLHRETVVSAFQYPFALNLEDCRPQPDWTRKLLQAIGELNGVAGTFASLPDRLS
jgi:hypothetical protein